MGVYPNNFGDKSVLLILADAIDDTGYYGEYAKYLRLVGENKDTYLFELETEIADIIPYRKSHAFSYKFGEITINRKLHPHEVILLTYMLAKDTSLLSDQKRYLTYEVVGNGYTSSDGVNSTLIKFGNAITKELKISFGNLLRKDYKKEVYRAFGIDKPVAVVKKIKENCIKFFKSRKLIRLVMNNKEVVVENGSEAWLILSSVLMPKNREFDMKHKLHPYLVKLFKGKNAPTIS